MRTHVTFQADFPKAAGLAEPPGRVLAEYLAARLSTAGFPVGQVEVHEGYAYTFPCRREKQTIDVFVALVDDGVQEWLAYIEPQAGVIAGWLQKLGVGRRRSVDVPELRDVCTTLHACLREDHRFRSVRWYTTAGWDNDPDSGWATAP